MKIHYGLLNGDSSHLKETTDRDVMNQSWILKGWGLDVGRVGWEDQCYKSSQPELRVSPPFRLKVSVLRPQNGLCIPGVDP